MNMQNMRLGSHDEVDEGDNEYLQNSSSPWKFYSSAPSFARSQSMSLTTAALESAASTSTPPTTTANQQPIISTLVGG